MNTKTKHIVVFTGAGMSAEIGLHTFRDKGGIWEEFPVHEVATASAWKKDKQKVLHFYNLRRQQVRQAEPNAAHLAPFITLISKRLFMLFRMKAV